MTKTKEPATGGSPKTQVDYNPALASHEHIIPRVKPRVVAECPPQIAKAIAAVQARITSLTKDSQNQTEFYKFVSIDSYYENIRPLLAEEGLILVPSEREASISSTMIYRVIFDFIVLHESGETWDFPIRRTVFLHYEGAQTAGMALSYADKFFMRTLFKIATGEPDPTAAKEPEVETQAEQVKTDADEAAKHTPAPTQDAPHEPEPSQEAAQAAPEADEPKTVPEAEEIQYDYSGPAYRVFGVNMEIISTFTETNPWFSKLRTEFRKADNATRPRLLQANMQEIERVKKDINADQSIDDGLRGRRLDAMNDLVKEGS